MAIIQIETHRLRIYFDSGFRCECDLKNLLEINLITIPFSEQPPGQMTNHIHMRIIHGSDDSICGFLLQLRPGLRAFPEESILSSIQALSKYIAKPPVSLPKDHL